MAYTGHAVRAQGSFEVGGWELQRLNDAAAAAAAAAAKERNDSWEGVEMPEWGGRARGRPANSLGTGVGPGDPCPKGNAPLKRRRRVKEGMRGMEEEEEEEEVWLTTRTGAALAQGVPDAKRARAI
jgi:hypothetical protein